MTETTCKRSDLDDWCRVNWDRIPEDKRRECLDYIRPKFTSKDLEILWRQHARGECIGSHIPDFHFLGGGTAIRNALREVLRDDQLPPVKQKDGTYARNWDDFYTGALEQLCEEYLHGEV